MKHSEFAHIAMFFFLFLEIVTSLTAQGVPIRRGQNGTELGLPMLGFYPQNLGFPMPSRFMGSKLFFLLLLQINCVKQ